MKKILITLVCMAAVVLGCKPVETEPIPVSGIRLDRETVELARKETLKLEATLTPADAQVTGPITWITSDRSIATVDEEGTVTANEKGKCTITAAYGKLEASCEVTVVAIPVSSITLDKSELSLIKGESAQLTADVQPIDAEDRNVTWSSSDESVCTVDKEGMVQSLKVGEAVITAAAGEYTAECSVTVNPLKAESVTLSITEAELVIGESITIMAEIFPEDADETEIKWTTSDGAVCSVENGLVTALSDGEATVTATVGSCSAGSLITVISSRDPKLGDYLFSDMTYSSKLEEEKTPIGLICYLNDDLSGGKVVSLKEYRSKWDTEQVYTTGAKNTTDGKANQDLIMTLTDWQTLHPIFLWTSSMTEGGLEWYLPASKEIKSLYAAFCGMKLILEGTEASEGEILDSAWQDFRAMPGYDGVEAKAAREIFNEKLTAAGGDSFKEELYFSSTEKSYKLQVDGTDFTKGVSSGRSKLEEHLARAIAIFEFEILNN